MKILVTGARGFVGKNLCSQLNNIKEGKAKNYGFVTKEEAYSSQLSAHSYIEEVFQYDIDSDPAELEVYYP